MMCLLFVDFWATWEDVRDPLSSRCSISATKCGTISCRNSRPRPDVEKLASTDYLQSYFSLQSSFKIPKLNRLTSNSFLTLQKRIANWFQLFLSVLLIKHSPWEGPLRYISREYSRMLIKATTYSVLFCVRMCWNPWTLELVFHYPSALWFWGLKNQTLLWEMTDAPREWGSLSHWSYSVH